MKRLAHPLVAFVLAPILGVPILASAQAGPPPQVLPEGIRGGSEVVPERGVEVRHYTFQPTGEQLPYSVYVSSKVRDDSLIGSVRDFSAQLDRLQVAHEYIEMPGLDHGTIIMGSMPNVFRFFARHVQP